MNCCEFGQCKQGHGCPARETPITPALARRANERIRRLEAGRAHLQTLKTPLHIRAWDWLGNLPHRLGRWVDRSPLLQMAGLAVGAVTACALAALTLFHK